MPFYISGLLPMPTAARGPLLEQPVIEGSRHSHKEGLSLDRMQGHLGMSSLFSGRTGNHVVRNKQWSCMSLKKDTHSLKSVGKAKGIIMVSEMYGWVQWI